MTNKLSLTSVVSVPNELLSTDLSETEMVMMHIDKGLYYGLEDVGKTIWDSLIEPRSVDELCDVVVQRYSDTTRDVVEPDVVTFLGELLEEELIVVSDAS